MAGGYYRYDIPDSNLTFLGLNSMFFKRDNECALGDGAIMMKEWMAKQLEDERDFILGMHVYPGLNWFNNGI